MWRYEVDDYKLDFSTRHTWEQIRVPQAAAVWYSVVWLSQGIPRCSFITWLAIRDRLSTGIRMRMWGVAGKLLGSRLDPNWDSTLDSLARGFGSRDKNIVSRLYKNIVSRLCFQITIYFIWREGNSRVHGRGYCLAPQMVRRIDKQIRNRIVSLDYAQRPRLRNLLQTWFEVSPIT
ncbi:unnamed protein product [Arabidopsis halleri]